MRDGVVALGRPIVLGILNVTPDSFSDGGAFASPASALAHAERMLEDGADVLDIGGESTRPRGAVPVDAEEEIRRVVPVIRSVRSRFPDALISVDTVKSDVAAAALGEGARIVNDVSAFRIDPRMGEICAREGAGVILMHSRGGVRDMATYLHATYDDVVGDVVDEISERRTAAERQGIARDCIVVDPGVGFSKRGEHSISVLRSLPRLAALGSPVLVGVSRKRFIGEITGVSEAAERDAGTTGANVAAMLLGARLFRVHDVRMARHALDVAWTIASGAAGA